MELLACDRTLDEEVDKLCVITTLDFLLGFIERLKVKKFFSEVREVFCRLFSIFAFQVGMNFKIALI